MNDPKIVTVAELHPDSKIDPVFCAEASSEAVKAAERRIPERYADAVADREEVAVWVSQLIARSVTRLRLAASVRTGPSLLLLGGTGTGKTFQAFGAIRALAASGAQCQWIFTTAAEMYANLRPRNGKGDDGQIQRVMDVPLLVIDDLGAAKSSEWTEEINYRVINHRYERMLPTLITSNVPPKDLSNALGERVASRLIEMTTRVVLDGGDRRRKGMAE